MTPSRGCLVLLALVGCKDEPAERDFGPTPGGVDRAPTATAELTALVPEEHLLVPPAAIGQESSWCWFLATIDGSLGVFVAGMDSGTIEEFGRYGRLGRFSTIGMAYTGTTIVAGDGRWYEIDLAAGRLRKGVTSDGGAPLAVSAIGVRDLLTGEPASFELVMQPGAAQSLEVFPTFGALDDGTPRARLLSMNGFTRFQIDGTTLYGAWHSTRDVLVYDIPTGTLTAEIRLQGFNTWVNGIGFAGGMLHLMDDGRQLPYQRIARFAMDGTALSEVSLDGGPWSYEPSGLWCDAPATAP